MGFFSKEKCILCSAEAGALARTKLNNGSFLCSNCVAKTGLCQGFSLDSLKGLSLDEIKERIRIHAIDMDENSKRLSSFSATFKVGGYIWFDDNHNWFLFPKGTISPKIDNCYVFKYDEIVDFEVLEDGTIITKGGLGKALIGGALFGLAGAIAGGTSKKTKDVCTKLEIKITTNNSDRPIVYLNLLHAETKKNSFVYKQTSKTVQDILSKFQIVVDKLEQEKDILKNESSTIDVANEIKKFKELLDMGAITQEEFDAKKKQLLGL
ncbi:MAG: SHOCT domain-containing protein [Ruminococcus sp.]|nr:SHOCT domain-containing protein [Ruminococcus sp.]